MQGTCLRFASSFSVTFFALGACCGAEGNTDPEHFRWEYEAAVRALEANGGFVYRDLHDIDFVVHEDWRGFDETCSADAPCLGHYSCGTIDLPPLPEDPCGLDTGDPKDGSTRVASTIVHEVLHAQKVKHSAWMKRVESIGWLTFAKARCPEVFWSLRAHVRARALDL